MMIKISPAPKKNHNGQDICPYIVVWLAEP